MANPMIQSDSIIDEFTLSNGLRVVGERLPYLRTVSIGAWLQVGSMLEKPEESGLSHFMEHMVFKGTEKRTARQIAEEMDAVGGQMNAFTGKDCTCFYAKVIDEDIELAVDMLADMLCHATLDEHELNKERGVVLEEIAMDEDSPEDIVSDVMAQTQFGDQPLGMPILGPEEQISSYTRDDLVRYRASHYCPRDTVLALCGNYDPDKLKELCETYFGAWQNDLPALVLPQQQVLTGRRGLREKDTEQLHLCLGYAGLPYGSSDAVALSILSNVLGGAMSSRLFQRVREELGMAYSIYSYTNSYPGCGTLGVYAGINPENAERVMQEIAAETEKLLSGGITEKEFRDSRQMLRSGHLMSLESSGSRMQMLGRRVLLLGRRLTHEEILQRIDSVTMDQVMDCARTLLTVPPCVCAVGPGVNGMKL